MFSETVEWTGAEHLLARRAANAEVAEQIVRAVVARERMVRDSGGDIRAQNPGPQNKAGGLTTIEEKALGAIAKGGKQPIHGVLRAGASARRARASTSWTRRSSRPSRSRRWSPAARRSSLFTTGAGNSYCSLVAPTLKMSANPETCARLTEQIDIAAADVARRHDDARCAAPTLRSTSCSTSRRAR